MQIHKKILNKFLVTEEIPIDSIIPEFDRRSLFNLPIDFINTFIWINKAKPVYVVSVGPKVGFLLAVASCFSSFRLIHWFTGQQWSLKKIKFLSLGYICDFTINLLAYKTICDSKEQATFLRNNYFLRKIFFEELGSINCVPDELHKIGKEKIKKLNFNEFKFNYPIKVGFLGRICLEKGLDTIMEIANDDSLNGKFKFFVRGPSDNSLSKSNNFLTNKFEFKSNFNLDFEEGFIEKREFFNSIDIFLLPSKREGFGSVALEAQACGIPVVCSDIYGLYSSVINGYGGIYCKNSKAYKTALNNLADLITYKKYCNNAYNFSLNYSEKNYGYNLFKLYGKFITLTLK